MNKLEIRNLSKKYGDKYANKNINLILESGVYGLLGPNGAGKTSLMKQIASISQPSSGEILYNGENIEKLGGDYRNIIGYLSQDFEAYKNFSAKEFLEYMAALKDIDKKTSKQKIGELLELVGLNREARKKIGKFSGGMKRRLGIAQALLNDPKILILDEPTAGLDPQERARLRNLLSKISKDKIVILSTHIISDIESIAKETIMIKKGEILIQASHREILSNMNGKVYSFKSRDEGEIEEVMAKYKIVNIQRNMDYTELRFVSDRLLEGDKIEAVEARFEDVYMFYFDLEDGRGC